MADLIAVWLPWESIPNISSDIVADGGVEVGGTSIGGEATAVTMVMSGGLVAGGVAPQAPSGYVIVGRGGAVASAATRTPASISMQASGGGVASGFSFAQNEEFVAAGGVAVGGYFEMFYGGQIAATVSGAILGGASETISSAVIQASGGCIVSGSNYPSNVPTGHIGPRSGPQGGRISRNKPSGGYR
jgi:hypothetical protein